MTWIISVIVALLAYFIFKGFRARHIARCNDDDRTTEKIAESITASDNTAENQSEFHARTKPALASTSSAAPVKNQPLPAPHDSPSLLYAERKTQSTEHQSDPHDAQKTNAESPMTEAFGSAAIVGTAGLANSMADLNNNATLDNNESKLDLSAETATLSKDDIGIPANSSAHTPTNDGSENKINSPVAEHHTVPANEAVLESSNFDLELGDTTHNEADQLNADDHNDDGNDDDNDELLDFGDLTADISEMLKELNLRETDSPRLELDPAEYQQLKTGEPGEVKPEKIENVAGKLRNMLQ